MQRALSSYQRGATSEAEQLCRRVLDAKPDYFDALFLSGVIAVQAGHAERAIDLLSKAVAINPGAADAQYNLGVALGELGRNGEAVESYGRAIALDPNHADAHYNRGVALAELERPEAAIESYDRVIAINPGSAEAFLNRGIVLSGLGRYAEALASYDGAIALKPSYPRAYNNRGVALAMLDEQAQALESYDRAIALRPDYADAHNNRGIALLKLDRAEDALLSHERAIALNADHAEAHYNRGNALRELGRFADAASSFERAIALKPDHASAHWNLADCRLLFGDFERGWREYAWRWKPGKDRVEEFTRPLWLGEQPLGNRTILLHSELGMGDTLNFCRYASNVAALGANVVLEVQPPLLPLLAELDGVTQVVARGETLPLFDYHCPLMSLPMVFKTDFSSIPANIPYVRTDAARGARWQARLGAKSRPRIGIVWGGSMRLSNDKRSLPLSQMLPLIAPWGEWVSLQKEVRESDLALLESRPDIRQFGSELTDFAETAALMQSMDLVVSVDTGVAHLAGAIGKPVWILLPFVPVDWRWMLEREDSPWYPSARLFRQSAKGDWVGVVGRIKEELPRHFGMP